MQVIHSIEEIQKDRNTVVTVGTYDGVHLGHQRILREVVQRAQARKGRSVCVTFDPHPKEIVGKDKGGIELLTTLDERIELLKERELDLLLVLKFTYEFSRQTPRQFYEKYLVNGIGISEEVGGYDHMFGRDRTGSVEELRKIADEFDFAVTIVPPVSVDGEIVSSTKVRQALREGEVQRAARYLGREYVLSGTVVKGAGRGAALGFPTANIEPLSRKKLVPKDGVYFVRALVGDQSYFGMMNIGVRPTFETDHRRVIEVHLFEFDRIIYGERIVVKFLQRIRDEIRFSTIEDLITRMHQDRKECLKLKEQFNHHLV